MNLLTSFDWLKEYVDLKGVTPEAFASRVSLCGPGVERLYPQGTELTGIVVGVIKEIKPHPNADKLKIAMVDVGKKKLAQIVCGGTNIKEGQAVPVAQVGARVRWHGEGELVELKPTEIRGVESEGMICAANEIGLYDAFPHAEREILDLSVGLQATSYKLRPGTPLADLLGLSSDTVMDIEVTTNRPDAMAMVGMAREAAAILKKNFLWKPAPRLSPPSAKFREPLRVTVADKKLCPRYMAVKVVGVSVAPSPWWLKRRLLSAGVRPINNIVDITNFVLLELGQPMHAFDADKLADATIRVRKAQKGETFGALDGKTYALDDTMLVVADAEKPVAVAGIMGGELSGTHHGTTSVVFEAATFDPVSIRRTSRKLNLQSDSQSRFEKGLSTEAPPFALARAVELCLELAGGRVASNVVDVRASSYRPATFSITTKEVNALIGVDLPAKEMKDTLKRLGFQLQATSYKLQARVPWWRDHDIESGRDLVEEIARIHGYGSIPAVVPVGVATRPMDPELVWEDRLRTIAQGAGLTETYTYSFVSKALLERAGYGIEHLLRVQNPLSADFEYMRTTLLPSLIQAIADNQERFREQALFEIAHVYYPKSKGWKELPDERLELGAAFFGGKEPWKKAKGFVEHVYRACGIDGVTWKPLTDDPFWHPGRSVQAFKGTILVGTMGEVHPSIAGRFKLDGRLALVDLPLEEVVRFATTAKEYRPLPLYPEAKRDLALLVPVGTSVADLDAAMCKASALLIHSEWFDTYRGKDLPQDKKSVAFHLTFQLPDRTLETHEVDAEMRAIGERLQAECGASVRA